MSLVKITVTFGDMKGCLRAQKRAYLLSLSMTTKMELYLLDLEASLYNLYLFLFKCNLEFTTATIILQEIMSKFFLLANLANIHKFFNYQHSHSFNILIDPLIGTQKSEVFTNGRVMKVMEV